MNRFRAAAGTIGALVLVAACSSPAGSSGPVNTTGVTATATAVTTLPTGGAAAGAPCSFLTAAQVGTIVGTTPIEVAERPGRGDCDYWLTAAKDAKVNIGVFQGADALALFESTKGIGTPQPVALGDEAYSIYNASIGTLVVVKQGDRVITAQVFAGTDAAEQLRQATAIATAVLATR